MKKLYLQWQNAYRYEGNLRYLIVYDYMCGRKNRYRVLVLNVDDPVTIGRELPMGVVKGLIADYEEAALTLPFYTGRRADVLKCLKKVTKKTLNR